MGDRIWFMDASLGALTVNTISVYRISSGYHYHCGGRFIRPEILQQSRVVSDQTHTQRRVLTSGITDDNNSRIFLIYFLTEEEEDEASSLSA